MSKQRPSFLTVATLIAFGLIPAESALCQSSVNGSVCQRTNIAVVTVKTADSTASGFLISDDGWIATSEDAVHSGSTTVAASQVSVVLQSGTNVSVSHLFEPDIAGFVLIKIPGTYSNYLPVTSTDVGGVGDPVTVLGEAPTFPTPTNLCVSGSIAGRKTLNTTSGQIDLLFLPGSFARSMSGAPVVATGSGNVIGMLSHRFDTLARTISAQEETLKQSGSTTQSLESMSYRTFLRNFNEMAPGSIGTAIGITRVKSILDQARELYRADHP